MIDINGGNNFLLNGDCLDVLKELPENSIDSCVVDPPYGLGFMGKHWDNGVPDKVVWGEVFRVLKPGSHLLSFGGTRTYHRMATAIEDAGFEIRDMLSWLYGSGFPKSYNIGKGISKMDGKERDGKIIQGAGKPNKIYNVVWKSEYRELSLSDNGKIWEGWGSGLKPACEPIVLARKPLSEKSIVENVLKWGVGGLNIDASRIGYQSEKDIENYEFNRRGATERSTLNVGDKLTENKVYDGGWKKGDTPDLPLGRFPANVLLDEVSARLLDEQSGVLQTGGGNKSNIKPLERKSQVFETNNTVFYNRNVGGASRFFYVAKASKRERNEGLEEFEEKENKITLQGKKCKICKKPELSGNGDFCKCDKPNWEFPKQSNHHPTVKPVKLMEYLIKLVTPVNGIVLDCFMGSGTTGVACKQNGFRFVGIEKELEYFEIAKARIENAKLKDNLQQKKIFEGVEQKNE